MKKATNTTRTQKAAPKKDWREVSTIDEGEIRYLVKRVLCSDGEECAAALLLLIDAIEHDRLGLAAFTASKTALFESDAGSNLLNSYTKRLRSYFSREGNKNQAPDLIGALGALSAELERSEKCPHPANLALEQAD